jgi:DNA recombination protein RmuC
MEIILLIAGVVIGVLIGFLIAKSKSQGLQSKIEEKTSALDKANLELGSSRAEILELNKQLSKSEANFVNLNNKLLEQKNDFEELNRKFQTEFENLANKILEEKSKKFVDQNKENLDTILIPLKERIADFEKKVNEVYISDTKERASLAEQIKNLHELNRQMTEEANNLTKLRAHGVSLFLRLYSKNQD